MSDKWVLVPVEPTPEMLEPMAREDCKHDGFDPDEPMPPHGQYPRWYDRCGPFAEIYLAMLDARPAAPVQEVTEEDMQRAINAGLAAYDGINSPSRNVVAIVRAAIRALKRGEG
jgi:hypothetical protein